LIDFGLAKTFRVGQPHSTDPTLMDTDSGLLLGTVDYMSPEQAFGHKIDHRSDIFSFGVVLYEAATGCLPFSGGTAVETINRIINVEPRPIGDLNPLISPAFERIISKCLVKKANGRYPKAADILDDLTKSALTPVREEGQCATNNFPQPLTSFIGRERELAELKQLLTKTRLLTLTGSGGIGKTRLALQLAGETLNQYTGGAWFVDLGSEMDSSIVVSAIASAVGIQEEERRDLLETICDYFHHRHSLLVIDNCEHLISACATLIESLLRRCGNVTILATSREPLTIAGEIVWCVPALSAPDSETATQDLFQYEAVQLFVDRASAAFPGFVLDANTAQHVKGICCQLEGIPLAMELTAPRVRAFSLQEIHLRLNDRLRFLSTGNRTGGPRHQTLLATLDWSHNLLSEKERILLRRTSVFVGGFTLQGVEEVCVRNGLDRNEVVELLTWLVDKSLVLFQRKSARYRLLETVREYAFGKLEDFREIDNLQRQHAAFYLRFSEEAKNELLAENQPLWFQLVTNDYGNIRSALQWLANQPDGTDAMLRIVEAIRQYWLIRGDYKEGRTWAKEALERSGEVCTIRRAAVLECEGDFAHAQGDHRSARLFYDEMLLIARTLQDRKFIGKGLLSLGHVAHREGDFKSAGSLYEQSLSVFKSSQYTIGVAGSLGGLGTVAYAQGNYALARNCFEQALMIFRNLRALEGIASSLLHLGHLAYLQSDYVLARTLIEESLTSYRALGAKPYIALGLSHLGEIAVACGDLAVAQAFHAQSIEIGREIGANTLTARFLNNLANVMVLEHKYSEAQALYEEGLRLATAAGDKRNVANLINGIANLERREGHYDVARSLEKQGLTIFKEISYTEGIARSLTLSAVTFVAVGDVERAAHLFGSVEALYETMAMAPAVLERTLYDYEAALATTRLMRGDEQFLMDKARGRTMPLTQAILYALA
jgi:predicted ATPase